jgi:NADH-quinone oxidoreductase subunit J
MRIADLPDDGSGRRKSAIRNPQSAISTARIGINVETLFYISACIAIFATVMVVTRRHAMHALLYLVVSLLAAALVIYSLGAPFAAAMEAIIYAGAIMVLLVFLIMLLDLGQRSVAQETRWLPGKMWIGPAVLGGLLLGLLIYALWPAQGASAPLGGQITPQEVGAKLMDWHGYALGLELASMLLLAALVGVVHLLKNPPKFSRDPKGSEKNVGRGPLAVGSNSEEKSPEGAP